MATHLSLPQLIQLGFELCGRYALNADTENGFAKTLRPLSSPDKLAAFLGQCGGIPGVKAARHALTWVIQNSWSPMETDITIMMILPVRMGGLQFPRPMLNWEVPIEGDLRDRAGHERYFIDLYWPRYSLGVEYDSLQHHSSRLKANLDLKRVTILEQAGITIKTFTEFQVFRLREFDTACKGLSQAMGRKYMPLTTKRSERQMKLRCELFTRFGPGSFVG
jgi:hypothetical protein